MPTYVAFLRAINLGAVRKFPPAAIKAAAEGAGFGDVATHINTGNVRLTTRMRSRARIEAALEEAFEADRGFAVPTVVLSAAEVRAVVADAEALSAGRPEGARHYVSLLKAEPTPEGVALIEGAGGEGERAVVRGRAVHLLLDHGYQGARLENAAVERAFGVATNRNVTVVRAVCAKWCTP